MKTVYLVRHGESSTNKDGIVLGAEGTPLTERGIIQAEAIAARCSQLTIEHVTASPALRTKQTAEVIAKRIGKEIDYQADFLEWDRGSYRIGRHVKEKELLEREQALIEHAADVEWRDPDPTAETFNELLARADRALTYLTQRPEQHLLVVGHGIFTRVLIGRVLLGSSLGGEHFQYLLWNLKAENTGLTIIQSDDRAISSRWRLITWNDHAHLG